jgi:hypothetical protein
VVFVGFFWVGFLLPTLVFRHFLGLDSLISVYDDGYKNIFEVVFFFISRQAVLHRKVNMRSKVEFFLATILKAKFLKNLLLSVFFLAVFLYLIALF